MNNKYKTTVADIMFLDDMYQKIKKINQDEIDYGIDKYCETIEEGTEYIRTRREEEERFKRIILKLRKQQREVI